MSWYHVRLETDCEKVCNMYGYFIIHQNDIMYAFWWIPVDYFSYLLPNKCLLGRCRQYWYVKIWCCSCGVKNYLPCGLYAIIFSWGIRSPQDILCHCTNHTWFTHHQLECNLWDVRKDECKAGLLFVYGVLTGLLPII